jgi:hypothetical protein
MPEGGCGRMSDNRPITDFLSKIVETRIFPWKLEED